LSASITKRDKETIGTYIDHLTAATGMTKIGDVIRNWIYDSCGDPNRFPAFVIGIFGSGTLFFGVKRLYSDIKTLLNLWKKFEKNEKIIINWRLMPRNVILSTLAIPATLYGLVATSSGFYAFFRESRPY